MTSFSFVQRARNQLKLKRQKPIWFDTVTRNIPPYDPSFYKNTVDIGRPKPIQYVEDRIRVNWHSKFPLEALRPAIFGKRLDELPEDSVEHAIRRQVTLMEEFGIDEDRAFQLAEREFKERRAKIELEQRLARQQAEEMLNCAEIQMNSPLYSVLLQEKDSFNQ